MTDQHRGSCIGRRAACLAIGAIAAFSIIAGNEAAAQDKPIRIGMTTDQSGIAAAYARSQINGAQLAIDQINGSGGLLGRKVELLVRDSQLKPDLGISHTRDLITRENVDFLLGPVSSGVAMAISSVARQYKKVVMMTVGNTARLTMEAFHPYMFTVVPSGVMETRAMAEAIGPKFKRFAFIGGNYEPSHQGIKNFKEWLAKVNPAAEIVSESYPKLGETDYTSHITSIMSARPEAIYSFLWGSDLHAFVKQAKPYGLFDRIKVATVVSLDDLVALGPEMPDGVIAQTRALFFAIESPRIAKFVDDYRAKHTEYPADWAVMTYEGMQILADAVRKAGTVDSDAVVKAAEQTKYDGLRGPIAFRTLDHQGTVGSFIGTMVKSDKYPFKVMTDVSLIAAEKIWSTPAEVEQARKPK